MEALSGHLSEPFVNALGWTVVHSLWQGALLALLLSLFRGLTGRLAPQVRYWAGVWAMAGLLGLSAFTFWMQWDAAPSAGETVVFLSGTTDTAAPPYLLRLTQILQANLPLLVAAWLLGMLFFAVRTLGGFWYLGRLRHSGRVIAESDWEVRLAQLAGRMKIFRPVALLESARVSVPMVIGHLKPVVLMPVGLVNQLSPEEVEAILAHELAHIRRHDYLVNLIQSFLEAFYYFNPAVWYISATIRTERENCCDDQAVALCGNSLTYVRALVHIGEQAGATPQFALSAAGANKPLLQRVRRLLHQPNHKRTIMERFSATLLLLAAVAAFSISAGQPDETPPAPEAAHAALTSYLIKPDTTPPAPRSVEQIVKEEGDRRLELTMKDGTIAEFRVDGEVVPPQEYGKYQKELDGLQSDLVRPHLPPPPPAPSIALPPPPPPPPHNPAVAPAPPVPGVPPAPPAPGAETEIRVITKKTGEDGRVMIWVDENEGTPHEIVIEGGEMIFEDEDGEKKVIVIGEPELRYEFRLQEEELKRQAREMERHAREMERQIVIEREMQLRQQEEIARSGDRRSAPHPRGGSLKMAIENELRRDGYMLPDGSYTFELSGKKLVINGNKESDVIFAKYKGIYEKHTGLTLSKDSRIEIEE